jgi:hypothetical protein
MKRFRKEWLVWHSGGRSLIAHFRPGSLTGRFVGFGVYSTSMISCKQCWVSYQRPAYTTITSRHRLLRHMRTLWRPLAIYLQSYPTITSRHRLPRRTHTLWRPQASRYHPAPPLCALYGVLWPSTSKAIQRLHLGIVYLVVRTLYGVLRLHAIIQHHRYACPLAIYLQSVPSPLSYFATVSVN